MEVQEKIKKLKKISQRIHSLRRHADTFGEEVVLNHIVYSVEEAIKHYQ